MTGPASDTSQHNEPGDAAPPKGKCGCCDGSLHDWYDSANDDVADRDTAGGEVTAGE